MLFQESPKYLIYGNSLVSITRLLLLNLLGELCNLPVLQFPYWKDVDNGVSSTKRATVTAATCSAQGQLTCKDSGARSLRSSLLHQGRRQWWAQRHQEVCGEWKDVRKNHHWNFKHWIPWQRVGIHENSLKTVNHMKLTSKSTTHVISKIPSEKVLPPPCPWQTWVPFVYLNFSHKVNS